MKTALQLLLEQIERHTWYDEYGSANVNIGVLDFDYAKYLERQQIVDAVTYGNRQEAYDGTETIGEKYYKETYE